VQLGFVKDPVGERLGGRGTPPSAPIHVPAATASPARTAEPGCSSARAVEYHVRKVFTQPRISSRRQLSHALTDGPPAPG
jgi:hypothetical protein